MGKLPYEVGDLVTYEGGDAFITLVCRDYIVVCTHQWPDEGTLHGHKQVNVLVYRRYWDTIHPRNNAQNTQESTIHSPQSGH